MRKRDEKEKEIQKNILKFLWYRGIYCWRNNSGAYKTEHGSYVIFGKKGSSDIIGILPDGKFLAIEVKTRLGKLTEHQKDFLKTIKSYGGVSFVARNLDDVKKHLNYYI